MLTARGKKSRLLFLPSQIDPVLQYTYCYCACLINIDTNASTKKLRDVVNQGNHGDLLKLLMNTAQFEFVLKNIFQVS